MAKLIFLSTLCVLSAVCLSATQSQKTESTITIVVDSRGGDFCGFVGRELQKYIRKLTGRQPQIVDPDEVGAQPSAQTLLLLGGPKFNRLVEAAASAGQVQFKGLKPEGFILKDVTVRHHPALVIGGNDEAGTMYGAYDWLERQGIVFQLVTEVIPEQNDSLLLKPLNVRAETSFPRRGIFVMDDIGTAAVWSFRDYKNLIDQMAKLKFNYFQLYWYSYMPFLTYSYRGEKIMLGDISSKDAGYVMWKHDLGSYRAEDMPVGREAFARLGKRYMAPDELQGMEDPTQAMVAAQDLYRRVIQYARSRKVNVWMGIDTTVFPPNLARYGRPVEFLPFHPIMGSWLGPTDPVGDEINTSRMTALLETYPEAEGYFLYLGELYADYSSQDDRQLIRSMRSNFAGIRKNMEPFKQWGWKTVDQAIDSIVAETYMTQKMLAAGKRMAPQAKIGVGGIGNGFVFPILDKLFPKDVPFTDMEAAGVWTEKGVPMEMYGGMGQRERTIVPRLDDDSNLMELQFNVNEFYKDKVLEGSLQHGLAGFAANVYRPRANQWNSKFLSEGAWNPHLTPDQFYFNYATRIYGPNAAAAMVRAFQILEQKEAYGGYYYFGPLDNPCCGPPSEIGIAKDWADSPDPYDGPGNTLAADKTRTAWPKFMEALPKRIEVFNKRISFMEKALDHFNAAQPSVAHSARYELSYLLNKTEAYILELRTMVQLLQAYVALDGSFHVDRQKDRPEFLAQLDNSLLQFQRANQMAHYAALKWAELVDHPDELEGLRRINVFMVNGTDLIQKFVGNVDYFHHGKPYWDQVDWEKIFTPGPKFLGRD